ncbi:ArnT family glycosyltransferase [Tundrisphaera lichenicola]|uniref:ArnT family glycosyltransferase n=1 Tax=Tundrisphaera lichenicola TaxID=2029860 RepID=UPI003EBB83B4
MGSPLTFWKLQQAPALWILDRVGHGSWVDDPIPNQAQLLPIIRIGGLWIWVAALLITADWSRRLYGPRAMALASVIFALSPNLLAHGALSTMELPATASILGMAYGFWWFLRSGRSWILWATGAVGGLAFSCKFTTILIPPILSLLWAVDLIKNRPESERSVRTILRMARTIIPGMIGFGLAMAVSNLLITGFASITPSANHGVHPIIEGKFPPSIHRWISGLFESPLPSDWVAFATQMIYQRNGGPSYLLGERRMSGWVYYYPLTLAVKVPLAFWILVAGRIKMAVRGDRDWMLAAFIIAFLLAAMLGSKRNYGIRYLLPVAPIAIIWVSAVAEGCRKFRWFAAIGLVGMATSVAGIHPHELTYFNEAAGGPIGGRRILSDSNLDWGQGAKDLAKLQKNHPEFADLTLFYFGDTDPAYYKVQGRRFVFDANQTPVGLPDKLSVATKYLAVSASLQWGPWGPPGYFRALNTIRPIRFTDDTTIALYRTSELDSLLHPTKRDPGRE